MTVRQITGHDGVRLEVTDLGPADAPPIVLIHGYSQAALSWQRQHRLAGDFRLIIPDLRGHGASEKPSNSEAYTSSAWASDIAAILSALALDKPILVGWSMGGWVLGDYIRHHGDDAISGFALIGSSVTTGDALPAGDLQRRGNDADVVAKPMIEDDLAEGLAATVRFVRACFHQQPESDDLALMVGFNTLCPPIVRRHCRSRNEDFRPDYAKTRVPALALRGVHERLSLADMHAQILETLPRATSIEYENSGHAPFWEEADRFNQDLAAFAKEARP